MDLCADSQSFNRHGRQHATSCWRFHQLLRANSSTKTQQLFPQGNPTFSCRTSSLRVRCAGASWKDAHVLGWNHLCYVCSLSSSRPHFWSRINRCQRFDRQCHPEVPVQPCPGEKARIIRRSFGGLYVSEPDASPCVVRQLCELRGRTFVDKSSKTAMKHMVAVLQRPHSSVCWRRTWAEDEWPNDNSSVLRTWSWWKRSLQ